MIALNKFMRLPKLHDKKLVVCFIAICFYSITIAQSITQLEYYFGADPGFGNGTMVTANTNTGELSQALTLPVTGLEEGFQQLSIRALDNQGTWGLFQKVTFYISENSGNSNAIANITGAEYWFDDNQANATALAISGTPNETNENFVIPLGDLEEGFHSLFLRTQNTDGTWSLYDKSTFFVFEDVGANSEANIAGAEYWFDDNQANATALTISGTPNETTEDFIIPLNDLEEGFHSLFLRVQNTDGIWSLYDRRIFYVFEEAGGSGPISSLAAAEYWFDNDPGPGNGTELTISGSPNSTTETYTIPLGNLEAGFHKLGLRAQNENGTWSLYDKRVFYIFEAEESSISPLTEMEFLYDAELGFGTGESVAITPTGNPNEYVVEIPTDMVSCDFHDLWVSIKNEDGNYSLYNILEDVEVYDNADPTIVVFEDITVVLDENGQGSITIDDVNNGTYDDCELVSVVMTPETASYDCNNLGANTVTITATDAENKVSTLDVTITVIDNIDPVAFGQNITVQLDSNGDATITGTQVDNGSTDNCTIASRTLDINSFTCDDLGDNDVILTVTDQSGNSNTTTVTVTVEDNIAPSLTTQNITVELGADGTVTLDTFEPVVDSSDNCILDIFLENDFFTCDDLGDNIITVTAEDGSGNSTDDSATITVVDNLDPVVIGQNIIVQLDSNGDATITANQIDNGSTDNCTIANRTLDINSFTCDDLGDNDVILTVTDQSGNSNTTTVTVTVEDNIAPSLTTQNITVELGADGTVTLDPFEPVADSGDNCILDIFLENDFFTCDDLGDNIITVTAEDGSGNSTDGSATITVVDNLDPIAIGQNITVQLDNNGDATITANQIDNGSTDNCTIANRTLNITSFTCDDLGDNDIILTVTDQSGNSNTTTVTVTVEDNIAPSLTTQNITVELGSDGTVTLDPFEPVADSGDNCILDIFLENDFFTCDDLGDNIITVTAEDGSGNSTDGSATITVVDNIDPVAIGQNITVQLDNNGDATITGTQVDNGSTDNCTIASRTLDINSFTCDDLGDNDVILTVTDQSGNSNTTTVTVTVEDVILPNALGQDITIDLAGANSISITASDVDNGSNDNCTFSLAIDQDTFTEAGEYPVVLTITDSSGNSNSVTVTVTVIDSTLSISSFETDIKNIKLYPVPAKNLLNIKTDLTIDKITLFDVSGKELNVITKTNKQINVTNLPSGVYFIKIMANNTFVTKRFIKE